MADVIEFAKNGAPRQIGEVNEELIAHLETMLEQAKSGVLLSSAYVGVYVDGSVRHGWEKRPGDTDPLASGIMCLHYRISKAMAD